MPSLTSSWSHKLLLWCLRRYNDVSYVDIPSRFLFFHSLKLWTGSIDDSTKRWYVREPMNHSLLRDHNFHLSRFLLLRTQVSLVRDQNPNWSWAWTQFLACWFWENGCLVPNYIKALSGHGNLNFELLSSVAPGRIGYVQEIRCDALAKMTPSAIWLDRPKCCPTQSDWIVHSQTLFSDGFPLIYQQRLR